MKTKTSIALILTMIFFFFFSGINVQAENVPTENSFSISPMNPDTGQPQSTYYNLKVTPNEEKDIKVRVFSSSDKEIKVNVNVNNAGTNSNGVVSYTGKEKKDSSLKIPFSSIAQLKETQVTIPPKGHYDVTIHIKMPNQAYSGMILGGIRVTSASSSQENVKQKPAVKANIAYSIAVVLKEDENNIEPDMHLLDVQKENRDYQNFISAKLQNSAPRLIKKLEADAKVYKKGSDQLLYEAKKSEMEMAPNSNFNFGINLEGQPFKAGDYTMKISGKADGKPYSFEKDFTITSKEAKTYNENSVYTSGADREDNGVLIAIVICVVILLTGSVAFGVYEKRKNNRSKDK
ncbi:DUF916 and DUF3324 domain-containing protein [Lactococcus garvieae]|uniref:DUF916 and DUF3324 domain-containing protein n=1 Tax=Lactococcus garvieae TaxID=1363 RepID=UPI0038527A85